MFDREVITLPSPPSANFIPAFRMDTGRYVHEESDEKKALPIVILGRRKPRCPHCQSNKCTYVGGKNVVWRIGGEMRVFGPTPLVIHLTTGEEKFLDVAKCRKGSLYFLIEWTQRAQGSLGLQCMQCKSVQLDILVTGGFSYITCRHCEFGRLIQKPYPLETVKRLARELKLACQVGFVKDDQGDFLIRLKKDRD